MNNKQFVEIIDLAIKEDVGKKDITGSLVPINIQVDAVIVCRKPAVICGCGVASQVFAKIDPEIKIDWLVKDGAKVQAGKILCRLSGSARSLLAAERTALNFLQTLSSTATLTRKFIEKLKGTKTELLDTRKTLPGLRLAQKYAVKCGGGNNHRFGLYDAILLKENHIAACGSISCAIALARKRYPRRSIEVEVRNFVELYEALTIAPDIIMLDNFSLKNLYQAVKVTKKIAKGKTKLEVSGGVNLQNVRKLAKTEVDYISVGAITKTVIPIELSMLFV